MDLVHSVYYIILVFSFEIHFRLSLYDVFLTEICRIEFVILMHIRNPMNHCHLITSVIYDFKISSTNIR